MTLTNPWIDPGYVSTVEKGVVVYPQANLPLMSQKTDLH